MKLIVGLGNPGEKYKNTRHNAGFWAVDRLAARHLPGRVFKEFKSKGYSSLAVISKSQGTGKVILLKPLLYMNRSGVAVKKYLKKFEVPNFEDLWVIHDDLDIKLGEYKIGKKGPREHNGLRSIYEQIGVKDFWHVRIGIDNGEFRRSGEEYVLGSWRPKEREVILQVMEKVIKELENALA